MFFHFHILYSDLSKDNIFLFLHLFLYKIHYLYNQYDKIQEFHYLKFDYNRNNNFFYIYNIYYYYYLLFQNIQHNFHDNVSISILLFYFHQQIYLNILQYHKHLANILLFHCLYKFFHQIHNGNNYFYNHIFYNLLLEVLIKMAHNMMSKKHHIFYINEAFHILHLQL